MSRARTVDGRETPGPPRAAGGPPKEPSVQDQLLAAARGASTAVAPLTPVHLPPPAPAPAAAAGTPAAPRVPRVDRRLRLVELYAGTARSAAAFAPYPRVDVALLADHDAFAAETYRLNHPRARYLQTDVGTLSPQAITAAADGPVDILLGCPPCQGFSDTGLRDPLDARNEHLTRFAVLAAGLRPLAVAMENVPLAAGTTRFAAFASQMDALGYRSTWGILNAALHGSAQCRHRLIYVGLRKDVGVTPAFPAPAAGAAGTYYSYRHRKRITVEYDRVSLLSESPGARRARTALPYKEHEAPLGPAVIRTVRDVFAGLPRAGTKAADALSHYKWQHTDAMRERMLAVPPGGRWEGGADHFSHAYGRLHQDGLAPTLTTFFPNPGSGRYWHPTGERTISIREAARLQGFPDEFRFAPTDWMQSCRLVGNALDASLAAVVARMIGSALT